MITYKQHVWLKFLLHLSHYIDSHVSNGMNNGGHSKRVALLVRNTARRLNRSDSEIEAFYWAALLHDIGKVGVPLSVLSKAGPLTNQEWAVMKLHPTVGTNIIQSLNGMLKVIAPIILSHQEKYDGTGYPYGLKGEEIPFGGRILAVVDAYDAMTNDRAYRNARTIEEAIQELRLMSGKHFDPRVVRAFLKALQDSENESEHPYFHFRSNGHSRNNGNGNHSGFKQRKRNA
jgi:putative nucleotidyltransferase with HDIG domain